MNIKDQTILALIAEALKHPNELMRVDSDEGSLQIKWIPKETIQ